MGKKFGIFSKKINSSKTQGVPVDNKVKKERIRSFIQVSDVLVYEFNSQYDIKESLENSPLKIFSLIGVVPSLSLLTKRMNNIIIYGLIMSHLTGIIGAMNPKHVGILNNIIIKAYHLPCP